MIFHIDANSAYLSWTAVKRMQDGKKEDIRNIPSVISGNPENRKGIVLAKSIIAKKYGIETGEEVFSAINKCPNLKCFPPDYELYLKCSNAMVNILEEYSPKVQRYSIDECFIDMKHLKENYLEKAIEIKNRIKDELGFTVNIGISSNKLLAKMASDFEKPNKVHTLFKEEIREKMWPLKVEELFMVGKATKKKLNKLNIYTIEDLANYDLHILQEHLKSFGYLIYKYANGEDNSEVRESNYINIKGIGNSTTVSYDIDSRNDAIKVLLSLLETVTMRLRNMNLVTNLVVLTIKTNNFISYSHQKNIGFFTDSTMTINDTLIKAFDELWNGEKIRQLGVRVSNLQGNEFYQESIFNYKDSKLRRIDETIDQIRSKYGNESIIRGEFLHSGIKPISGGVGEIDYPMMGSIL